MEIVEKVIASQKSTSSVDKSGKRRCRASTRWPASSLRRCRGSAPKAAAANTFAGKGATENSNDFFGSITVIVVDVLPNGHLLVAGEKQIGVNSNVDVLRFSGQVDPLLIQAGNTMPSVQIANVRARAPRPRRSRPTPRPSAG